MKIETAPPNQPASRHAEGGPPTGKTGGPITLAETTPGGPFTLADDTDALTIAEHAIRLEDEQQERAAVEQWRRLFGWRMPRP